MNITLANQSDLKGLLTLYTQMKGEPPPPFDQKINSLWAKILNDPNHYVIVGKINDTLVSSCNLMIIKNLTHDQRPFALIENVVTDEGQRNKGYATTILNYAKEIALSRDCYKIMLMTGSKKGSTLNLYRKAGYNTEDKTGFIQWL